MAIGGRAIGLGIAMSAVREALRWRCMWGTTTAWRLPRPHTAGAVLGCAAYGAVLSKGLLCGLPSHRPQLLCTAVVLCLGPWEGHNTAVGCFTFIDYYLWSLQSMRPGDGNMPLCDTPSKQVLSGRVACWLALCACCACTGVDVLRRDGCSPREGEIMLVEGNFCAPGLYIDILFLDLCCCVRAYVCVP